MGADEFGDSGGMAEGAHGYSDSAEMVEEFIRFLPNAIFRLAKPQAHAYIFCDMDWFAQWKVAMSAAGWQVFRTPFIWHKPTGMRAPWPDSGPQRKYETILYAVKGKKPVTKIYGDVLSYPSDKNLGHGAQKPVELYRDLLLRSITPGDTVLDCCCGTGPIFPAAHALKCRAVGIEMDPVSYAIAAQRIKELV
jgi:DNA modification methylase